MRYRRRKSSPNVPTPSADPTIFARARPCSVLVEEHYAYEQMISRNPSIGPSKDIPSRGSIQIVTPYDGDAHFTREAIADVQRQLPEHGEHDADAVIGHLVLVGHHDTDLAEILSLAERFGAHRVTVPVRSSDLAGANPLQDDRYEHRFVADYSPNTGRPSLIPIVLDVELVDPDNFDGITSTEMLKALEADDTVRLTSAADAIKRFIGFKPFLQLAITAQCTLPSRSGAAATAPVIRRVSVTVPTPMSLSNSSLELVWGDANHAVQYRPESRRLEWFDVDTIPDTDTPPDAPRRYRSPRMELRFHQPGELLAEDRLTIEVDVEVPEELLSGTQVRLFDARGYRVPRSGNPLSVRSVVRMTCTVALRETFAKRLVSPYQSLHFDEVVPDPLRITDIQSVLHDQRFTIPHQWPLSAGEGKRRLLRHLIVAERADGPDTLTLHVLVEGRRHVTQREARRAGGHRYTSKFDSGELWVFVRGQAPRDARTAVHEINQLHLALRERFRHLRAQR